MLTELASFIFWYLNKEPQMNAAAIGDESNLDGWTTLIEVLNMTINKYFVFVPQVGEQSSSKENEVTSKEAQRQALVKQAQQQGGL